MTELMTGTFTRAELIALGWTDRRIAASVKAGELVRVAYGVYAWEGTAEAVAVRSQAVLSRLADDAVISHHAAALAHGLPIPEWNFETVRATRPRGGAGQRSKGVAFCPCPFDEDDVVVIDGLRVTSLARTVVDVARHSPVPWGLITADAAFAKGLTRSEMVATINRGKRRPGNANARQVADLADARSESPGESRSRGIFAMHGVPAPQLQVEIFEADGTFVGRVDMLWEEEGLIGEFDGEGKYDLHPEGREAAKRAEWVRDGRLRGLGWDTVHWGWPDLTDAEAFCRFINQRLAISRSRGVRGRGIRRPHPAW